MAATGKHVAFKLNDCAKQMSKQLLDSMGPESPQKSSAHFVGQALHFLWEIAPEGIKKSEMEHC